MSSRARILLEIGVLLLIAAAVDFVPGGGNAASAVEAAIWVVFGGGILWMLVRVYRERRLGIHSLGDGRRALLYGALAVGFVVVAARARMWQSGLGELVFWVLLALVAYTLFELHRFARRY